MRLGIHTIKSGFSEDFINFAEPRRYSFDNGDYTKNFRIRDVQLIPQNNNRSAGSSDVLDADTVFFVIATTKLGAIPQTAIGGDMTVGDYDLRLSDNRQIAWGVMAPAYGYAKVIIDPGHIITDDIFVNVWSHNSAGNPVSAAWNLGFMIVSESVGESGAEGLLNRARESAVE